MKNDGKIRLDGLVTSGDSRSGSMNASRATGFYGNGMKGMSRPRSRRSPYLSNRHAKTVGLLVAFAAVIAVVSVIALGPIGKENASQPEVPAKTLAPGPPYNVYGYTYDSVGAPLAGCSVTVTDLRTTDSMVTTSSASGKYQVDLGSFAAWLPGDDIKVTAVSDPWSGENQSQALGLSLKMDVTLDVLIPEFPMVIVPVMGMIALVAVVSLRRRGEEQ